jgi:hypothetical protein
MLHSFGQEPSPFHFMVEFRHPPLAGRARPRPRGPAVDRAGPEGAARRRLLGREHGRHRQGHQRQGAGRRPLALRPGRARRDLDQPVPPLAQGQPPRPGPGQTPTNKGRPGLVVHNRPTRALDRSRERASSKSPKLHQKVLRADRPSPSAGSAASAPTSSLPDPTASPPSTPFTKPSPAGHGCPHSPAT